MLSTVIESPLFAKLWPDYWSEDEYGEFVTHLAQNPTVGDLIVGSGGCRKARWAKKGSGKSGGVRVIYTVHIKDGVIVLLTIYGKSAQDAIPAHVLRKLAEELGHAQ